jgi:polyhydroxyalkanoate synthase subunit PhaC
MMKSRVVPPQFDTLFKQFTDVNQSLLGDWQTKVKESVEPMNGFGETYQKFIGALSKNSGAWAELQKDYYAGQMKLWESYLNQSAGGAKTQPAAKGDRRFSAAEWTDMPLFDYIKQSYLLASDWLMGAVEKTELDPEAKRKMLFFARQYVDAMSPSNFLATNPEVLKLAMESNGESLAHGLKNLMADVEKGRISMTDETKFAVGKNIATQPGEVVFENELIQLIQYTPTTKTVHEKPLLLVPPCINKFYLMDLEPENSFVRFAVEQGHTVFMVSWRNVKEDQQHLTWDNYLELGVIKAIEVTRDIGKSDKINLLGFCVGGTLVSAALAVLAARGDDSVASVTLMTSLLEFTEVGDIGAYIDENMVRQREQQLAHGGLVSGKELAMAFSSLRANDLIWQYVVNNYLKGKTPEAFNLLYWNSDGTNLPGPMYAYYLRHFYWQNELVQKNKLTMCGQKIDIGQIDMPAYVFAAKEDHIVPWTSSFNGAQHLGGKVELVLGASGHIAGSMNPASKNKRNFWVDGKTGKGNDAWLASAKSIDGSWWSHWAIWLKKHAGRGVPARGELGNTKYKSIEAAPGRYVMERCD